MFAEQKILEFIYQGNTGDAEKMLLDMFPGELKEFREKLEKLVEMIEDLEEGFGDKKNG